MTARQTLVDILGKNFIDLIFTENRSVIEGYLFDQTVERLQEMDVGVELVALNIVELAPIAETIDAFRDVSDAIAERLQMISNAERESERMVARSRGQAEAVRKDAEAKARERVTQAASAATAFLALLESYLSEPLPGWTDAVLAADAYDFCRCDPAGRQSEKRFDHRHQHD